jgi:predicted regulator of Ras-like GTPase activity (Roadblock/LC7/MglB family)
MLEPILQSLRDVEGVQGAMVVDPGAGVVAHRAHAIYDLAVLQQVARSVINTVDSVQLIQDDWDMLTAHFGDGKLLLRSLRVAGARPRRYVLTVIADSTLNVAFLGVALRVAATKLLGELEAAPQVTSNSGVIPIATGSTGGHSGRMAIADQSRPELAKTGLSWSGSTATVTSGSSSGSGVGSSDVGVSDPASSTFLSACTKALAASVGPMAKVFVKEAVRKVCGERPFSRADGPALLAHLASGIEDSDDRASFQRATRTL